GGEINALGASDLVFDGVTLLVPVTMSTATGDITAGAVAVMANDNLTVENASGSSGATFASLNLGTGDLILSGVADGDITVTGTITAGTVTTGIGGYNLVFDGGGTLSEATTFNGIDGVSIGANFMFEAGVTATAPPVTITDDVRIEALATFDLSFGAITIR